jgi:redox-sensitive bicupin YhaK (pirin superfamily)
MDRKDFIKKIGIMATVMSGGSLLTSMESSYSQKKARTIHKVISPTAGDLGTLTLKNIVQGNYQNYVSPFYLFDEFGPMHLAKGAPFRVDAHPHAGIIPTTYVLKGNAHHRDSMDNDFEYQEGDFIYFNAGKGALHMEETGDELYKNGGVFQGFQGWLNIPSKLKKSEPYAGLLKKGDIKLVEKENSKIRVILGEIFDVKSEVQLLMPVIYWHISINENGSLQLPIDPLQNAFIYVQEGQLVINEAQTVNSSQTVLFERDGDYINVKANAKTEFLVLGGEVNNEKYVSNGPFVLDNEQDLASAYTDFQQGRFGDLAKTNGKRRS